MRLFIADANREFRLALQVFLHQEPNMDVVGLAAHSNGLLAQIEATKPDVLLLDCQLPDRDVAELITEIRALKLPIKIVVISIQPDEEIKDVDSGADAIIEKTNQPEELKDFLRSFRDEEYSRNQE
jgi:DNA-binding NarL/FixJ family response regulator